MAAMFRALSTRGSRNGNGYEKLVDESTTDLWNGAKLSRSKTAASPGRFFSVSKKAVTPEYSDYLAKSSAPDRSDYRFKSATPEYNFQTKSWTPDVNFQAKAWTPEVNFQKKGSIRGKSDSEAKYAAKEAKKASKIHPLFSLFEKSSKKKPTAKPEFARYVQYLKEGGAWDANSGKPVIF